MQNGSAKRFADALVILGQAAEERVRFEQDLDTAAALFAGNEDVRRFLADPLIKHEGKRAAVEQLMAGRVHPVIFHFIMILMEEGQILQLGDVKDAFAEAVSALRDRASGELVAAHPLSAERLDLIEQETGRILGKDVQLRARVDEGLLGGFYLRVGDFVMDGTVEGQLEDARERLIG